MNEYGVMRITTRYNQSRVRHIYTDTQYMEYLESNDYSSGGIAEYVGNPLIQVKPYLDLDSDTIIFTDEYINEITKYIQDEYGLTPKFLKRKDRIKNGKYTSSLRIYMQNARISHYLIPVAFEKLFNKYESIDKSVYNIGRILHTLGNKKKGIEDVPVLEIYGNTNDDIQNYFATYIEETFTDLDDTIDINIRTKYDKIVKDKLKLKEEVGNPITIEDEENKPLYNKILKYINHLNNKRAYEYDSWISIIWAMINICNANDMSRLQIERLIHKFSEKADNYDDVKVDDWINKNIDKVRPNGYGWTYLNKCLYEDDEKYFNSLALSYYNKKKDFEKTHIKCMYPPTIITDDDDKIKLQTIPNSIKTYNHIDCYVKDKNSKGEEVNKKVKFINEWLKDHYIRTVKCMEMKPPPLVINDDEYNLWTGFKITKVPYTPNEDVIKLFLEFGHNLLGDEFMNYSIAIFAKRLQTPAERAYVLQLLYSQSEGSGKNTWFNIFIKVFGKDKFAQLESAEALFSAHSTEEEGRLFVLVDEAKGIDNYKNADKLKSRITCDRIRINPKGIQAYELDNYCDYCQTTNNHNCLPQTDQSRRFAPIEVNDYYIGNVAFFTQFNNMIIDNEQSIRCIYEFLMNFNIKNIIPTGNFQNHIPNTDFRRNLNEDNRNRVDLFIEAIANEDVEIDDYEILKKDLFMKFVNWMNFNRFTNNYNAISFGRKLSTLIKTKELPIIINTRKYVIDINNLKCMFR